MSGKIGIGTLSYAEMCNGMMSQGVGENYGNVNDNVEQEVTFGFPVLDSTRDVVMKNIPPFSLPYFHGMSTEDPYSFLFEFDILFPSYNYVNDA